MPKLAALTVSVGVLAVVATWLFGLPPAVAMKLQVWQAFIAWGCHFHAGGKFTGCRNTLVCMIFGAIVGMAAVICLASALPLLAAIPASVYGFAAIAGLILLGTGMSPTAALLPTVVSIVIGAAFGYVSEWLAGALTKKDAILSPAAA